MLFRYHGWEWGWYISLDNGKTYREIQERPSEFIRGIPASGRPFPKPKKRVGRPRRRSANLEPSAYLDYWNKGKR